MGWYLVTAVSYTHLDVYKRQEQTEEVANAYAGQDLSFGPEYLIPKPFDPRLMMKIAPAVAEAAAACGVAERPIQDMDAYRQHLQTFVYALSLIRI